MKNQESYSKSGVIKNEELRGYQRQQRQDWSINKVHSFYSEKIYYDCVWYELMKKM